MLKKLLLLSLVSLNACAITWKEIDRIPSDARLAVANPNNVYYKPNVQCTVGFMDKKFYVALGEKAEIHLVNKALSDKLVREFKTIDDLDGYFQAGGKFNIKEHSNGEYSLQAHIPLLGGGAGGATVGFWVGRFLGYGIIAGVGAVVTWSTGGTVTAVAGATMLPVAEAFVMKMSLAGAILGGAFTGPC